jgi:hypothetical protein
MHLQMHRRTRHLQNLSHAEREGSLSRLPQLRQFCLHNQRQQQNQFRWSSLLSPGRSEPGRRPLQPMMIGWKMTQRRLMVPAAANGIRTVILMRHHKGYRHVQNEKALAAQLQHYEEPATKRRPLIRGQVALARTAVLSPEF